MPEQTHMSLSAFDWSTILGVLVFFWFLLQRDYKSRDKLADTVENLSQTVAGLRSWMAENYVTRPEHLREIDRLEVSIADHSERWREELSRHREECPARRS